MVHLGQGGRMHPAHLESLRAALFGSDWYHLAEPPDWGDEPVSFQTPDRFGEEPPMWPHEAWTGSTRRAASSRAAPGAAIWRSSRGCCRPGGSVRAKPYAGCAGAGDVGRDATGHRGLPDPAQPGRARAAGRLFRPGDEDAQGLGVRPATPRRSGATSMPSRAAVEQAMTEYAAGVPIVFGVDLGHTDPQLIVPYGGDPPRRPGRRIEVHYFDTSTPAVRVPSRSAAPRAPGTGPPGSSSDRVHRVRDGRYIALSSRAARSRSRCTRFRRDADVCGAWHPSIDGQPATISRSRRRRAVGPSR